MFSKQTPPPPPPAALLKHPRPSQSLLECCKASWGNSEFLTISQVNSCPGALSEALTPEIRGRDPGERRGWKRKGKTVDRVIPELTSPSCSCILLVSLHSFQFSHSVVSDSDPQGLQHSRLPGPSPPLGACSNSWPLSR